MKHFFLSLSLFLFRNFFLGWGCFHSFPWLNNLWSIIRTGPDFCSSNLNISELFDFYIANRTIGPLLFVDQLVSPFPFQPSNSCFLSSLSSKPSINLTASFSSSARRLLGRLLGLLLGRLPSARRWYPLFCPSDFSFHFFVFEDFIFTADDEKLDEFLEDDDGDDDNRSLDDCKSQIGNRHKNGENSIIANLT